ncbi:hypothetical protein AYI69_g2797 [Smittium culicis]|uniref:Uncharacterized protein n=1 Tax=Smittium culicis TaxID=133412 RepID=A0A1R1YLH2_9FUNG|nr:hypothetical protein AYI69_g2797 [Smittium culicis]
MVSGNKPKENSDIDDAIKSILGQLGGVQACFEIENKQKIKFFKLNNKENLEKARKIELLGTQEYSDKYKFITAPSYTSLIVWDVSQKAYNSLKEIVEVTDITTIKHVNFNKYPPRSLKIILNIKNDKKIANSLNTNETKVVVLWKGGQSNCT